MGPNLQGRKSEIITKTKEMTKIADVDENPMGMPSEEELLIMGYDKDEAMRRQKLNELCQEYEHDRKRMHRRFKVELVLLIVVGIAIGLVVYFTVAYSVKHCI